ncbi:hypothetical protein EJB05_40777, partial [Eragrostis curvula]
MILVHCVHKSRRHDHPCRHCVHNRETWHRVLHRLGIPHICPSVDELIFVDWWLRSHNRVSKLLRLGLWKDQNNRVFEFHAPQPVALSQEILDEANLWTANYTCPVGFMFKEKHDVLDYCSSGALQRAIDANATLDDKTTLQGKYDWLMGRGWVLEIRAGGENFNKMFKFYAHLRTGVRAASKQDFLSYINDAKIPGCTSEDCDTSEDNIIAQLQFRIDGLPPGWVKETAFRKCSDGRIRRDSSYTDPLTKKVHRSLKSAKRYFTSEIDEDSHNPKQSVTDMYFFDSCAEMIPCSANRLKMKGMGDQKCDGTCDKSGDASLCRAAEDSGTSWHNGGCGCSHAQAALPSKHRCLMRAPSPNPH